jgi:hypothetical protein
MPRLRKRLEELNIKSRKNFSVPNPADNDTGILDQVTPLKMMNSYLTIYLTF